MLKILISSLVCWFLFGCTPRVNSEINTNAPDPLTISSTKSITPDSLPDRQSPIFSIPISSSYFTTDKLNQLYLVTDRNEVIKYDSKGKEVFRYNNNFLDNLSHVDATDPFNILLYYPDYLTVITLDRTMNKTGTFDLSDLNLLRVKAIGSSNDNNVWIFDEVTFQLKKINRSGDILHQSVDLNLQLSHIPKPIFLVEKENGIYVNDPEFGILVFNIFGEYESLLELKGIDRFQVFDNQLIYQKEGKVFSYHLQSFNQKEIELPIRLEALDDILIRKNRLFVRKTNRVEVYEI